MDMKNYLNNQKEWAKREIELANAAIGDQNESKIKEQYEAAFKVYNYFLETFGKFNVTDFSFAKAVFVALTNGDVLTTIEDNHHCLKR